MEHFNWLNWQEQTWLTIPLVFVLWVIGLGMIKKIVFKAIQKLTLQTKIRLDDILLQSLNFPLTLIILTSGVAIVGKMLPTADTQLADYFLIGFKTTLVIAIAIFIERFTNGLIEEYSDKVEILRTSGSVARIIVQAVVVIFSLLILLDSFGVSITPIIASLGIGSLAVALALQPTLENFFAGIQIITDKAIEVGQFIRLETGEEGYVHKIGWRSTWIRLLPNNMVILPNKIVVNSRILNYYYPNREIAVLVEVGVHYHSDLEQVERVTLEVARQTLKEVQGGVKNFEPSIRYHTLGEYSINFTVILRAQEFVDHYLIKHEFIKRLHKRYAQEGIVIPYPVQAVNHAQESAFEKSNS